MADKITGVLEVGTNQNFEIVVNHPDLQPDENGVGHIVFSIRQARHFAASILRNALEAELAEREAQRQAAESTPVDFAARTLTDGSPVTPYHREIDPATGQQKGYIVLSEAERAKGFVRPVRQTYRHNVCGAVTTMGLALAETYARCPTFYSGTFCATCKTHFALDQFVWAGTTEVLGL